MMRSNNKFKKYDKTIVQMKDDFRLVVSSILNKLLNVDMEHSTVKRIYVDLNSALSIVFRYEDISDDELLRITGDAIENFIRKHLENGITIYLLYNLKPSAVHRHIYPDWCKQREDRVSILKSEYLKKILLGFKVYSDQNPNLKIVNCMDVHTAMAIHELDSLYSTPSLILSRDAMFRCLIKSNICVYNGVDWIEFANLNVRQPEDIALTSPHETLAHYYTLRGDIRNEYKGKEGYGIVKSVKYIELNRLKIKAGIDHPLKEFLDKHLPLYSIKHMLKVAEEIKLDLTRFKNIK